MTANVEAAIRHREAMARLVVTPGDGHLTVDARSLMRDDNAVRYWLLHPEPDGTWSHYPSGEVEHPLSDHLWSIAAVYLHPEPPTPEPGACADPACPVLHADPANPIHPPGYVDSRSTLTTAQTVEVP